MEREREREQQLMEKIAGPEGQLIAVSPDKAHGFRTHLVGGVQETRLLMHSSHLLTPAHTAGENHAAYHTLMSWICQGYEVFPNVIRQKGRVLGT